MLGMLFLQYGSRATDKRPTLFRLPTLRNSSQLDNDNRTNSVAASNSDIRLFVGVLSASGNIEARAAIRNTWGADQRFVRLMFFVLQPKDATVFKAIRQEATVLGDVFVTSEVMEDYYNITYSVLDIFKAAVVMESVTHVVKTDDDVYFRPSLLLDALQDMPKQWLYAGGPDMGHGSVIRQPGWHYVPYSNWASDEPVRYAYGWGYVLSIDLVREIAAGAPHLIMPANNLLIIEDVAVAYWVDYVGREQNASIAYRKLHVASGQCNVNAVFFEVKQRPAWPVISCMYNRSGQCC